MLGWLAITAAFVAFALVGTSWSVKIPALQHVTTMLPAQLRGLPGAVEGFHPAEVACTLTWIIFLPVSVAIGLWSHTHPSRQRRIVALLLALTVVMGGVLVLTTSRSAWIGVAVGTGVWVFLAGRWGKVIVSVGLVIAVVAILIVGPDKFAHEIASSPQPELESVFTPNLESRVEIWSRTLYGIQDFPFTGMGIGTFRQVVHVLYPLFLTSPDVDLGHAHNEFLQAALDLGIPGLTAFLALQGMAMALAYKTFRSTAPNWMRWTAAGALAGLVAHGVYGLTDAVALGAKPGLLFWMLLGLIAALFEQARSSEPEIAEGTARV